MTNHFATYFDIRYLPRGLTLADSLRSTGADFHLHVLCLDEAVHEELTERSDPCITPWLLSEVEQADPELSRTRSTRTWVEYIFTTGPAFLTYLIERRPDLDRVTYLDADMMFLADPQVLFDEATDASTILVRHRFPPRLSDRAALYGRYNVAWVSFSNDSDGRACLHRWRSECIAWCHDRAEPGRFADQKYLDRYPAELRGVHVLEHLGADVAPWNCGDPPLEEEDGDFTVGSSPVVFFHFQGLRSTGWRVYEPGLMDYGAALTRPLRRLYECYIAEIEAHGGAGLSTGRVTTMGRARRLRLSLLGLLRGRLVLRVGGRLIGGR